MIEYYTLIHCYMQHIYFYSKILSSTTKLQTHNIRIFFSLSVWASWEVLTVEVRICTHFKAQDLATYYFIKHVSPQSQCKLC